MVKIIDEKRIELTGQATHVLQGTMRIKWYFIAMIMIGILCIGKYTFIFLEFLLLSKKLPFVYNMIES